MDLVSSSTNSGTPSVLARICSSSSAGSALPPASLDTIARALRAGELGQVQRRDMAVLRPSATGTRADG